MDPFGALWHLLNFFGPAVGVAVIAASLAKLLWRHELKAVRWRVLCAWAAAFSAAALAGGLVLLGRDGKIATYAAMVVACAAGLWWAGFGRRA